MKIIITGASGSGKSSIIKYLSEKHKIPISVSYTTREKRKGEEDGIDYNFITKPKFQEMIKNNEFEEFTVFNDNFYGTPKFSDRDYLFDLEYEGVLHFKKLRDNCIFIFIDVEKNELERRLTSRGATDQDVRNRMVKYSKFNNLKHEINFDLCVDNNRTLKESLIEIEVLLKNKLIIN